MFNLHILWKLQVYDFQHISITAAAGRAMRTHACPFSVLLLLLLLLPRRAATAAAPRRHYTACACLGPRARAGAPAGAGPRPGLTQSAAGRRRRTAAVAAAAATKLAKLICDKL